MTKETPMLVTAVRSSSCAVMASSPILTQISSKNDVLYDDFIFLLVKYFFIKRLI